MERAGVVCVVAISGWVPSTQVLTPLLSRAGCQSFQFLVDVSEFQHLVLGVHGAGQDSGKDEFDEFTAIVDEYIKDNSNSEINIDSSTKKKILALCERSAYSSLVLVRGMSV